MSSGLPDPAGYEIPDRFRHLFGAGALFDEVRVFRADVDLPPYTVAVVAGRTPDGWPVHGSAIGQTPGAAVLVAIAEAIERYSLALPYGAPSARMDELDGPVLDASCLPMFAPEQLAGDGFPYRAFDPHAARRWARGRWLPEGADIWVPADLVWLRTDGALTAGISTGTAAHQGRPEALLSGLYEVIERDALAIVWEARAVVPEIDPAVPWQAAEVRQLAAALVRAGLRLIVRDMTTDLGIPCVVAIIHDLQGRRPALAIGAAARMDPTTACLRAVREAYFCWSWMRDEHARRRVSFAEAWAASEQPREMLWQAFLYGFPEATPWASHLLAPAARVDLSARAVPAPLLADPDIELRLVCARLVSLGYPAIGHDLAAPEIAGSGLCVTKAVVPGLVPLSVGRWCRHLANPRIEMVPRRMAWRHQGPLPPGHGVPVPLP